jgi:heme/copper-type cytochrome/quinol oxidase subunit 1
MTMTESPPSEAAESTEPVAATPGAGLYDALTTSDHKAIGRIWLRLGLLLLLGVAVLGVLVALEGTSADGADVFGGVNAVWQMQGLYSVGLVLLVVPALTIGLATIVVPMQVGSSNIAFPRAAAAAAWGFVVGVAIMVVSVLAGGGWGALDGVSGGEADAIELTLLGMGMVAASILLACICLATTVVSLRTPGMGLMKTPLFAWSILVSASVWILTLPVLIANLIIIVVDLRGGPLLFGNPEGTTMIFDQVHWVLEQPAVFVLGIPVLGIIGSIVPVVAGARHIAHAGLMAAIGVAGLLAVGGWSQPAFSDQRDELLFVAFGLLAVVPVLASLALNSLTLAKAGPQVGLPPAQLLGALGAGLLLLLGTGAGALRVIGPFDLIGTGADAGVVHLVAYAAVVGLAAGMWFWASKIGGYALPNAAGLGVMLDFIGAAVLMGAAHVLIGFDFASGLNDAMAWVVFVGAILAVLGALGVVSSVASAKRSGDEPGDDPWHGHTLEWATVTPVPAGNFVGALARVTSEAPLLDVAEQADSDEGGAS